MAGTPLCGRAVFKGETRCNFTTGDPYIAVCDHTCTCECTVEHENIHVLWLSYCCKEWSKYWNNPSLGFNRTQVYTWELDFFKNLKDATECHGYAVGLMCITKAMNKLLIKGIKTKADVTCYNELSLELVDHAECLRYHCNRVKKGSSFNLPIKDCGIPKTGGGGPLGGG